MVPGVKMLRRFCFVLILAFGLLPVGASAASGGKLQVAVDGVNVRSGPGESYRVVDRLDRGVELTELGREGKWVNIEETGASKQRGWVLAEQVSSRRKPVAGTSAEDPPFEKFKSAVEMINMQVKRADGFSLFDRVENLGDGTVAVTVTPIWLRVSKDAQVRNLNTLFDLWDSVSKADQPIQVRMVDRQGRLVVEQHRR